MDKATEIRPIVQKNGFVDHTSYKTLSDEEIIRKVLKGQTDLFEVILRRYNQKLYRIARSYLSDEDLIKETMQNAYVKAYENLDQFRAEAKFSTWLVRITINEALKEINRNKRFNGGSSLLNQQDRDEHKSLIEDSNPEEEAVQSDIKRLLEKAVDSLPPKYHSVFTMREIEQMNTKETADCLDITRVNVKVRLYRAKRMLRKELEKRVVDTDIFNFKGVRCDRMVALVMEEVHQRISKDSEMADRK